jgi:hypothetical protein
MIPQVIRRVAANVSAPLERARTGQLIADSYRDVPQTADDDELAMANAIALTEVESW